MPALQQMQDPRMAHISDVDWNDPAVQQQWASLSDQEKDRLVRDRAQQRARDAGVEAANQKDWPKAFELAKEAGEYSPLVWASIGSRADSEPVVREALKHAEGNEHALGELLYEVASNEHFRKPENALSGELVQHMTDLAMKPHSKIPGVFRSASQRFTKHPNYDVGPHEAAQFWENYEHSVEPSHFATMEHHLTGQPTTLTDHRGATGSSADYPHALPHLEKYAQRARAALRGETGRSVYNDFSGKMEPIIKKVRGKHFVKVHRGIAGDYADAIGQQAGLDEEGNVDRAVLKIPTAAMSSWTVDPQVARTFAQRRITGQSRKGLIMSKWMPVEHLMHSGFHDVIPDHRHAHVEESELVFKHPERYVKVPTSSLHVIKELPYEPEKLDEEKRIHWRRIISQDHDKTMHALQTLAQTRPDVKRFMDEPTKEEDQAFMDSLLEQDAPYGDTTTPSRHLPYVKMARQYMPDAFPSLDENGAPHQHLMDEYVAQLPKKKEVAPVKVREQNQIESMHPLRPVEMGKAEDWAPQLKKGLAGIPKGEQVPTRVSGGARKFDYSHLLKPEHQTAGYTLHVLHHPSGDIDATIRHNGDLRGDVGGSVSGDALTIGGSELHEKHRGHGLGKAMYEALLVHGFHSGARRAIGGPHSPEAARVHKSLAIKHGLNYEAPDASKQYWAGRRGPYEYALKSEQEQFEELIKAAGIELRPLAKGEMVFDPDSPIVHAMLGHSERLNQTIEAARFLAGGKAHDPRLLRRHLWEADGDHEKAALRHYGIEPTEKALRALRGVKSFAFRKDEPMSYAGRTVLAAVPEGEDTAESVRNAFAAGAVKEVHLGGKHSYGTLLAHDERKGKTWLLKPGSGPQNPARGENEQPATQSECEVGFYQVVSAWGIGTFYPHADLVLIDSQQYAALEMLANSYQTINDIRVDHPGLPQHLFLPYLKNGILHKWAIADWILGQVDRNDGNIMAQMEKTKDGLDKLPSMSETENVKLIDEGSTWAGIDFDPAHDRYSFVPGYLRAWYDGNFNQLSPEEKLQHLPRVDAETEMMLREWLDGIDADTMSTIARKYRIDPAGAELRLANFKAAIETQPADLVVNQMWVTGAPMLKSEPMSKSEDNSEIWYHLTDNPNFALDPNYAPTDNSVGIVDRSGRKGVYLAKEPETWVNGHNYVRPYLAEFRVHPSVKEAPGVHGRWGGEMFVPASHYNQVQLNRVIPLDAHVREHYGAPGWIEQHHGTGFDNGSPLPPERENGKMNLYPYRGYKYSGPDVRQMTPEQHAQHKQRWHQYMKENRGIDMDAPPEEE